MTTVPLSGQPGLVQMNHSTGITLAGLPDLSGTWHLGRLRPGMSHFIEQKCPCLKAKCGLAIPTVDIPCNEHHGERTIRQAHHADDCDAMHRLRWRKRRTA